MHIVDGSSLMIDLEVCRIQVASKVPEEAVRINNCLVRDGYFDPQDMERVMKYKVRHAALLHHLLCVAKHIAEHHTQALRYSR